MPATGPQSRADGAPRPARLQRVIRQTSARTYGYDNLGRPSSVTRTIDGGSYTYQTAYDSVSRPLCWQVPAARRG